MTDKYVFTNNLFLSIACLTALSVREAHAGKFSKNKMWDFTTSHASTATI